MSLSTSFTVTLASEINAPFGSVTLPRRSAEFVFCAKPVPARKHPATARPLRETFVLHMYYPSKNFQYSFASCHRSTRFAWMPLVPSLRFVWIEAQQQSFIV